MENGAVTSTVSSPKAHHEIYLFFLPCGGRDLLNHRTRLGHRERLRRRGRRPRHPWSESIEIVEIDSIPVTAQGEVIRIGGSGDGEARPPPSAD